MAETAATHASRGHRTIGWPIPEPTSQQIINDPRTFRRTIDDCFQRMPELFPPNFPGYQLRGHRVSAQRGVMIRRVRLKEGTAYSIRPAFLMPDMTARTEEVPGPLFLRKFGVPFWALARVFGKTPMAWYRRECALGRFSVVGTTVRQAALPTHLLADEHHQTLDGEKVYIATTVGAGCLLGAEPAAAAGADDLEAASGVFKAEARDVEARYAPQTVSTDGWKGTQAAWKWLFPTVVLLLCFLVRVAQDPRPGQTLEGGVYGGLSAGLGGVPCTRAPALRTTVASAEAVGGQAADECRAGDRCGPV